MRRYILIFLTLLSCYASSTGKAPDSNKIAVVNSMIEGYNNHDYKAMQKPWIWWSKVFVTEKKLKAEFDKYFAKYGHITLDTLIIQSRYQYLAVLKTEKVKRKRLYFGYIFNEHGKLEGFGESYPPMIYRKSSAAGIVPQTFSLEVDSSIMKKYVTAQPKYFNGSIAVLENGVPLYVRHYGYANFDSKQLLNDTSMFELASVSKQFTATAILLLQQHGQLSLSDSLGKYFPELPYHHITIENLLTHSSGLPDYEELLSKEWDKKRFATNEDVIEQLTKYHPKKLFEPGKRFDYCNTGYVLLASIIEKVSGKSYHDFLEENIFFPLNMTHTRVYNTRRYKSERIDNYAYGYVYSPDKQKYILPDSLKDYDYVIYQDAITGDGTVNSCLTDLEKWEREILNPHVIPKEIFGQAFNNHLLHDSVYTNYGYGFFLSKSEKTEPLTWHTGGWPGYGTMLMNFTDKKYQVIILSNNEYGNFTKMADEISLLLLDE